MAKNEKNIVKILQGNGESIEKSQKKVGLWMNILVF